MRTTLAFLTILLASQTAQAFENAFALPQKSNECMSWHDWGNLIPDAALIQLRREGNTLSAKTYLDDQWRVMKEKSADGASLGMAADYTFAVDPVNKWHLKALKQSVKFSRDGQHMSIWLTFKRGGSECLVIYGW